MKEHFNDGRGARGIEGFYDSHYRILYIGPTNCRWDWVANIIGWLFPLRVDINDDMRIVNRTWWKEAAWLADQMKGLPVDVVFGYSKGGAQAFYFAKMHDGTAPEIVSIAGFPPWFRGYLDAVLVYKRGDIVPLFSKRRYFSYFCKERRSAFWKAHRWSKSEIQEVIYEGLV